MARVPTDSPADADRDGAAPRRGAGSRVTISRRAAWLLVALSAWSLYVWVSRIWIMAGQDNSVGFFVVHTVLASISIAFGVAAGVIGIRALRGNSDTL